MRQHAIQGAMPVGRRRRTTIADEAATRSADLVERRFVADAPDRLWVCNLTYLKTLEGFVYRAFVKNVFSRFITAFQLADNLRTDLVLDALEMAAHLRQPPSTPVSCITAIAAPARTQAVLATVDCGDGLYGSDGAGWADVRQSGAAVGAEARPEGGPERR